MPETVTPARVLTIREPHLSDILAGRKTVEFRGYIGPAKPTLIALHTSVKDDPLRIGQIVAVAVIVRCPHGDVLLCDRCLVTHARHTAQGVDLSRWPHGWHIDNVRPVKHVRWRGQVGLPRYTGPALEIA